MLNFFPTWSLKFFHLNLRYFGTMHAPKKKMTGNLYLCGKNTNGKRLVSGMKH